MRVGGANAGQSTLARERCGPFVGGATDNACVVGLYPVDVPGNVGHVGAALASVASEAVEGMGNSDKAALLADCRDRLRGGETGRH